MVQTSKGWMTLTILVYIEELSRFYGGVSHLNHLYLFILINIVDKVNFKKNKML